MSRDFDIKIIDVEPVSRRMKPIPLDCVLKTCDVCVIQFVIKKMTERCPFCGTYFPKEK